MGQKKKEEGRKTRLCFLMNSECVSTSGTETKKKKEVRPLRSSKKEKKRRPFPLRSELA